MTNVYKVELTKNAGEYAYSYAYHIQNGGMAELLICEDNNLEVFAKMVKNTLGLDIDKIDDGEYEFDVVLDLNDIEVDGIEQYF